MRILSWNCWGAGRASTVRAFKALVRTEDPDLVFIIESKSDSPKIKKLCMCMGMVDYFCVEAVGKARGLALFWKKGVEIEVIYSDKNVIASLIYSDPPETAWLLINVHGPPYFAKRKKFWGLMEELINSFSGLDLAKFDPDPFPDPNQKEKYGYG